MNVSERMEHAVAAPLGMLIKEQRIQLVQGVPEDPIVFKEMFVIQ